MRLFIDIKSVDIVFLGKGAAFRGASVIFFISAQLRFDACDQLQRVKRLCNIIVRTNRKPHNLVQILDLSGKHNNRIKIFFPELSADIEAVDIRKHYV